MKNMIYLFVFFVLLLPFVAFGDTYQDVAGTSQMIADEFKHLWDFMYDDNPSFIKRTAVGLTAEAAKAKFFVQLELIKFGWSVAESLINDLQIMSEITAQSSLLPQDVRQALVDMRFMDGLNLLVQAIVTRYVLDMVL